MWALESNMQTSLGFYLATKEICINLNLHGTKSYTLRDRSIPMHEVEAFTKNNDLIYHEVLKIHLIHFCFNKHEVCALTGTEVQGMVGNVLIPAIFEDFNQFVDPVRILGKQILIGSALIENENPLIKYDS